MEEIYQQKRRHALTHILGERRIITKRGFVETKRGLVLTSKNAQAFAAAKVNELKERIRVQKQKELSYILRSENALWIVRACLSKKTVRQFKSQVCPLNIRREIARKRTE